MGIGSEFKEFIARGNVVDLAVGVIIGGAFGKIVTSLVDQVIMPPVGLAMGGIDFSKLAWEIHPVDATHKEAVVISYGAFLNTVIQFLIVAVVIFLMVKAINSLRRQEAAAAPEPAAPAGPTPTEALLADIRDTLKAQRAAPAPKAAPAAAAPKVVAKPAKAAPKAAAGKPAPKAATRKPVPKKK